MSKEAVRIFDYRYNSFLLSRDEISKIGRDQAAQLDNIQSVGARKNRSLLPYRPI